jgi:hypothetical protein
VTTGGEVPEPKLHVVKILNARELVISGGAAANLSEGDVVRVLSKALPLEDPISGEDIGELVTTKAVLKIYQVAPRYALARTFRTRRVKVGGGVGTGGLGNIFSPPQYETRTESLVRDRSLDLPGDLAVDVGDVVELWTGPVEDVPSVTRWT